MKSCYYYCRRRIRPLLFLTVTIVLLQVVIKVSSPGELSLKVEEREENEKANASEDLGIQQAHVIGNDSDIRAVFLRNDVACRIPKLDPLHRFIKHLIVDPENATCGAEYPLLFKSTFNSTLVPLKSLEEFDKLRIKSCCYNRIRRNPGSKNDNDYLKTIKCFPISLVNATVVPPDHSFLQVLCDYEPGYLDPKNKSITSKQVDVHAFVRLNSSVEHRIEMNQGNLSSNNVTKANVVIVGIDSVSHMNFIRSMPKSETYLRETLGAAVMNGYNVIGANTYPNMVAALTSHTEEEVNSTCKVNDYFDNCAFIWKKFAAHGFRTAYGEDVVHWAMFNYLMSGFSAPPTDYYLRPFGIVADYLRRSNLWDLCYGPRLAWEVLLDYLQKFAQTMGKDRRYFQLLWSTALTHEGLNDGRLGDKHLLTTLKWFHEEGHLNQTVMIVMSDHGLMYGDILELLQGQLERRKPFMYILAPAWFKEKYARAYQNVIKNQDRLITAHDLYETLADLATLEHMSTEAIRARETSLDQSSPIPRGISLFLPIPLSRTCQLAGISDQWCVCRNLEDISTEDVAVKQAATYALYFINLVLSRYPQCVLLSLDTIKDAKIMKDFTEEGQQYQISFKTAPSNASFQATVIHKGDGSWSVSGSSERTNTYKNQSHCVHTKEAKQYCYCKDLMEKQES